MYCKVYLPTWFRASKKTLKASVLVKKRPNLNVHQDYHYTVVAVGVQAHLHVPALSSLAKFRFLYS